GQVSVIVNNCNGDDIVQIQTALASNPLATSRVQVRSLASQEPVELIPCIDLEEGEFLDISFGSRDTTATEGSFFLTRSPDNMLQQQVYFAGGNSPADTSFALTLTFPFGGAGVYFAPDAAVELIEFIDGQPKFTYRCVLEGDACQSIVINDNTNSSDTSLLEGTLNYVAEKVNIDDGNVVETDISVNAAFGILR
ncbi:MAG: hypothetical protein AAF597_20445, partial [Bacteroidota bacterium]